MYLGELCSTLFDLNTPGEYPGLPVVLAVFVCDPGWSRKVAIFAFGVKNLILQLNSSFSLPALYISNAVGAVVGVANVKRSDTRPLLPCQMGPQVLARSICLSGLEAFDTVVEISLPLAEGPGVMGEMGVVGVVGARTRGVKCRKVPVRGAGVTGDAVPGACTRQLVLPALGAGVVHGTGGGHRGGGGTGGELFPDAAGGALGEAVPVTADRADMNPLLPKLGLVLSLAAGGGDLPTLRCDADKFTLEVTETTGACTL